MNISEKEAFQNSIDLYVIACLSIIGLLYLKSFPQQEGFVIFVVAQFFGISLIASTLFWMFFMSEFVVKAKQNKHWSSMRGEYVGFKQICLVLMTTGIVICSIAPFSNFGSTIWLPIITMASSCVFIIKI